MPLRKTPFVTGQVYHVFNRSVASQPIFRTKKEYQLFINTIEYYHFLNINSRFSYYLRLEDELKKKALNSLYSASNTRVDLYAFCLMPNHYHLLVKQNVNNGISNFTSRIQNSYARYLNTKNKRVGSLYQSPFKGTLIETEEQFIHVGRYIHLNPLTSYILKDFNQLMNHPWCSFGDYLNIFNRRFITKKHLMSFYSSPEDLSKFTLDRLSYQRNIEKIKHIILEDNAYIPEV